MPSFGLNQHCTHVYSPSHSHIIQSEEASLKKKKSAKEKSKTALAPISESRAKLLKSWSAGNDSFQTGNAENMPREL